MGLSLQTCWHITWRTTAIWTSFNKHNRYKHSKNLRCDNVWLYSNNRRVGSIDRSFMELMSMNFNRWTSHERRCCVIRSSLALGKSERQSFGCVPWNERSTENWTRLFFQNHHIRWIIVLRVQHRNKQVNGKVHHFRDWKRRGKSNQMWKTILICFEEHRRARPLWTRTTSSDC